MYCALLKLTAEGLVLERHLLCTTNTVCILIVYTSSKIISTLRVPFFFDGAGQ